MTERAVVDLQRGRGRKVAREGYDRLLRMHVSLQRVQWNLLCFGLGKPVYKSNLVLETLSTMITINHTMARSVPSTEVVKALRSLVTSDL